MKNSNQKLTLIDHFSELRKRLFVIAVFNIIAVMFAYQFTEFFIQYILDVNQGMNLVYITPSELFLVYIRIAVTVGMVLASPITISQLWMFIAKGLYLKEKIIVILSFLVGVLFFVIGALFCYVVVLPITLSFFTRIALPSITSMISISSFVSFITSMMVAFGFVFELPVVIVLLSSFNLVNPKFLLKHQNIMIIGILVAAAFITPPDIISQVSLALPMILLFELSIGVSILIQKAKGKKNLQTT